MIRAGQLRHKITIQDVTTSKDDYGDPVKSWTDWKTDVRTDVNPLKGKEFFDAQQMQTSVVTIFKTRYLPGMLERMRIVFDGRYLDIQSIVDPDKRKHELLIAAVDKSIDQST